MAPGLSFKLDNHPEVTLFFLRRHFMFLFPMSLLVAHIPLAPSAPFVTCCVLLLLRRSFTFGENSSCCRDNQTPIILHIRSRWQPAFILSTYGNNQHLLGLVPGLFNLCARRGRGISNFITPRARRKPTKKKVRGGARRRIGLDIENGLLYTIAYVEQKKQSSFLCGENLTQTLRRS